MNKVKIIVSMQMAIALQLLKSLVLKYNCCTVPLSCIIAVDFWTVSEAGCACANTENKNCACCVTGKINPTSWKMALLLVRNRTPFMVSRVTLRTSLVAVQ